jgi:hypothetical protein
MKTLYWKTRPFRRTASGGRRAHWPGVALNLVLASALVTLVLGGLALAGLDGNFAELLGLADALLPIIATWALALAAVGLGYRLTVPVDRLPGEAAEPPAQRTTRWFHWANLRAVLFGGLAAATVLAAAWTLSSWQGRRAWEAYRAEAVKRGVEFDLEKLMPPPVPDAENFASTPLLRPFQSGTPEYERYRATHQNELPSAPLELRDSSSKASYPAEPNDFRGQRADLSQWQAYFLSSTNWPRWSEPRTPAEDVLKALTRWDAEIAELQAAAARPKARFNIRVTEDGISTLLTHLSGLKIASITLRLRAVAAIRAGKAEPAFADAILVLRLGDTLQNEPTLISHLVRIAVHTIGLRTIWEGMAEHRWTDAQLAHWQKELARYDFAAELRHAMAGERALGNRVIEYLPHKPDMMDSIGGPGDELLTQRGSPAYRVIPSGWFRREQISYNRTFDDYIVAALPRDADKFDAALMQGKSDAMLRDIERNKRPARAVLQHRVLSHLLLPVLHKTMHRACQAQTFTQLAIAACALERHWLTRGSYPESLAALAPEFGPLPPDPMSGQPFRYQRTADGRFRLWSLGWNGKDDGGTVAFTGNPVSKSRNIDFEQGDWVWPVPVQ